MLFESELCTKLNRNSGTLDFSKIALDPVCLKLLSNCENSSMFDSISFFSFFLSSNNVESTPNKKDVEID